MKATIPERNGERSRLPVSGLRRKPSAGHVPQRSSAPNSAIATAAKRRPRFSSSDSRSIAVDCSSPVYGPRRGMTIASVTQVPAAEMTNVETTMKK